MGGLTGDGLGNQLIVTSCYVAALHNESSDVNDYSIDNTTF